MNNEIKARLKKILEQHIGRHQAITRRELLQILGYHNDPFNDEEFHEITCSGDRQMRATISELIDEGLPVLSATTKPAGYYLPSNWGELRAGQETLKSYIVDLCVRKARLKVAGAMYLKPAEQVKLL